MRWPGGYSRGGHGNGAAPGVQLAVRRPGELGLADRKGMQECVLRLELVAELAIHAAPSCSLSHSCACVTRKIQTAAHPVCHHWVDEADDVNRVEQVGHKRGSLGQRTRHNCAGSGGCRRGRGRGREKGQGWKASATAVERWPAGVPTAPMPSCSCLMPNQAGVYIPPPPTAYQRRIGRTSCTKQRHPGHSGCTAMCQ